MKNFDTNMSQSLLTLSGKVPKNFTFPSTFLVEETREFNFFKTTYYTNEKEYLC